MSSLERNDADTSAASRRKSSVSVDKEHMRTMYKYNKALQAARESGDKAREAKLSIKLGDLLQSQGLVETAMQCYKQALEYYGSIGNKEMEAKLCESIGANYHFLGNLAIPQDDNDLQYKRAFDAYLRVGVGN